MTTPFSLETTNAADPWLVFVAIALATFVSEDLTCLGVGLLLATGQVEWAPALLGCYVGIVLSDLGVWLLGWVGGRGLLRWRWGRRLLPEPQLARMSRLLCERSGQTVVASRFLPGTRVPLFLAAGVLGACPYRFLGWAVAAAAVWVPAFVLLVAWTGARLQGVGWFALPLVGMCGLIGVKVLPKVFTVRGRAKLAATVAKVGRWEFWPAWVFYLPLAPWFVWLSVRHRGFTVWTAANPGIPASGVVGESKADILARLPTEWVVPTLLIPEGDGDERVRRTLTTIGERGWTYPLILKPDAGQRGAGVKKCPDAATIETYLHANPGPVIAQPFHPGPFEAGVFYYRIPGEQRGRIFSITDKVFPKLVGDGQSTLEELIWGHPRYRLQAETFLARHAADSVRILRDGEVFPLTMAGNHCQGTLFRDGGHLLTPDLEQVIDEITRSFVGFYIGRFDVRYSDPSEFRAGRGFAILELNGATSESTNLYDPSWSLVRAYRTLFRQWALLFRIGALNRQGGDQPIGLRELVSLVRTYYQQRTVAMLAD